ncbi:MAG: anti-sigma factor family protein [Fimbriimonadaceae bacterium]
MNPQKARDFYSAYYEGKLDPGLREAFERARVKEPAIDAEYREFEAVMGQLNLLSDEEIEIPADLHERVSARVDRDTWQKKNATGHGLVVAWRAWAVGAVAAVAIFGTLFALNSQNNGFTAGIVGGTTDMAPQMAVMDEQLIFRVEGGDAMSVVVRRGLEGQELYSEKAALHEIPLVNSGNSAALVSVTLEGQSDTTVVALPGSEPTTALTGSGSVYDFAVAAAGIFGKPIEVQAQDGGRQVEWSFENDSEDQLAVGVRAAGLGYAKATNGIVVITD